MSGGSIGDQADADDRQLVVITFSGVLDRDAVKAWNQAIGPLLAQFEDQHVAAVTIEGALSPTLMRRTEQKKHGR
jgi:hypothetical protein